MHLRKHQDHFWVEFDNGVSVEIYLKGRTFGGIGRVKCGRRDLRSPDLPILPLIVSTDGYSVERIELEELKEEDDGLTLTFRPYVALCGRTQEHDIRGEARWNVDHWAREPALDRGGTLWLHLKEANRYTGDMDMRGFSYGYKFRSRKYHVARIHDRATWELNGRATGNTLYSPGHPSQPRTRVRSKKDVFSTALVADGRVIEQFRPLFTDLHGFTFQFSRTNVLVTAFQWPFRCISLVQKRAGDNLIVHWHQLCAPPGGKKCCLDLPALEILCADSRTASETRRLSEYEAMRRELSEQYHQALGLRQERAVCSGELDDSAAVSKADLKRGIEELAAANCAEVVVPDLLIRAGALAREASAREAVGEIVDLVHRRGMDVGACLPASALRPGSDKETGADGIKREKGIARALADLKRDYALDALSLDPGPGSGSEPAGTRPRLDADFEATVAFRRVGEAHGCRWATGGPDLLGLSTRQVPYAVLRRNEFFYRDTVMAFPHEAVLEAQDDPYEAYFRGYANRLCYQVCVASKDKQGLSLDSWWNKDFAGVNKAYSVVREHMHSALVLHDDCGIMWLGAGEEDDTRVLWSFKAFAWDVDEGASGYDVMAARPLKPRHGKLRVEPCRVYLVQEGPES